MKDGCSIIIDPFGDVLDECHTFDDSCATATIRPDKFTYQEDIDIKESENLIIPKYNWTKSQI